MNNLTPYNEYISEGLSSVPSFLKQQYNNVFKEPNLNLNNLFTNFTKKIDTERNISNLYQRYVRASQTTIQNEINGAETNDAINKLITDEIKYFYFSLKPIVNKLQNEEFTMTKIFERSRDKRLQKLMSFPEDQFSNAVQQYVNEIVLPEIKKAAPASTVTTTERIKYDIYKILEADTNAQPDLIAYKKSAINWVNMSLFELLKPKFQLLTQLGANTSNSVDQLSKQMKSTTNDKAKEMILNKIVNMNKQELQNLVNTLGFKEDEIGKL